jgi:N-acetylglucosaminyldiphosphoundecaprenol N-acetyl-beta-D-mannosaminyltransferase
VRLLDLQIHPITQDALLNAAVAWGESRPLRRIYHANVHAMNLANAHADFKSYLNRADLVFCDGFGVKWGARLTGQYIPERLAVSDWIGEFCRRTGEAGQSVFALGDEPGVAAGFQECMAAVHRGYRPAGSHHGFFTKTGAENDRVIKMINDSGARHLLVGFGMPLQERWIEANADRLTVSVVYPVGATFRWFTGKDVRAPSWMSRNGLEWVHRFARHPIKLFGRYAVGNPTFVARILSAEARAMFGRAMQPFAGGN